MSKYTPIIGLEVHVELKTESKMFCACSTSYFGKEPNTHVCPVCLGLPGALPVPNKTAIEWCIKIALALKCEINEFSKFDRKNYFYPDLAKGYQISQYDLPFGHDGYLDLSNKKRVRIRRVHMEEDTGKLTHMELLGEKASLIDFNRSGVPLVEIVTEPDFHDAKEVVEYLQKLHRIVRYLDVSNADMDKGEMRLEPNISLSLDVEKLPPYKVEVKNINSYRFVEKAINYEIVRQAEVLEKGNTPAQETRGWNENKQKTFSQRSKEDAQDYRYFPEPDIPPIVHSTQQISKLRQELPELQDQKIKRFIKQYLLAYYDAEIVTRDILNADFYEESVILGKQFNLTPKEIVNTIINKKINPTSTTPQSLVDQIVKAKQTIPIDEKELKKIILEVFNEQLQAVSDFKNGKESSLMFIIGQVMKKLNRKADITIVKNNILQLIKD